jgi:uncharacterized membrane protein
MQRRFRSAPLPSSHRHLRTGLLWLLAAAYSGFGVVHLRATAALMPLMPPWAPFPHQLIVLTGLCEIAGAAGLVVPPTRRSAAAMLALYAVCVWPANLHHALSGAHVAGIPDSWWYHGPRLAFQPVLIWAPLWAAGITRWPFAGKSPHPAGRDERAGISRLAAAPAPTRRRGGCGSRGGSPG